jgi:hypothetical protein
VNASEILQLDDVSIGWTGDRSVLLHLIAGQCVEHCKRSVLQRSQAAASLCFLRDIQAHLLVTLVKDRRLSSAAMGLEYVQSHLNLSWPDQFCRF